jgi:hypothetical protein
MFLTNLGQMVILDYQIKSGEKKMLLYSKNALKGMKISSKSTISNKLFKKIK